MTTDWWKPVLPRPREGAQRGFGPTIPIPQAAGPLPVGATLCFAPRRPEQQPSTRLTLSIWWYCQMETEEGVN